MYVCMYVYIYIERESMPNQRNQGPEGAIFTSPLQLQIFKRN